MRRLVVTGIVTDGGVASTVRAAHVIDDGAVVVDDDHIGHTDDVVIVTSERS